MNRAIVILTAVLVVLVVSLFLNVGFYRCSILWEDCAVAYQAQAVQDANDMQVLLDSHADEVILRRATEAMMERAMLERAAEAEEDYSKWVAAERLLMEELAQTKADLQHAQSSWEMSFYFNLDLVCGIDWLREEATKAQIKRWFNGDETDWNAAITAERKSREAALL